MPIKKQTKTKRQNRPSEVRLSGVPPIMPIKTPKSQNRPSDMFIRGPPYNVYKTAKLKKKTVQIEPEKYVYQGSPI